MNDLCADIGYKSINHHGEELCGDHIDIVEPSDDSTVIVLSDGLGSGVKASILSTLTSKIISTMLAEGLSLEECVETIAATLPVCSVRGVAYSTFTIIHLKNNQTAELIQYDNPHAIIIRDEKNWDYPKTEMNIGGKQIFKSVIKLQENDVFVAMSDGCPHAGIGMLYNFGWKREDIIDFVETLVPAGYTAKTLSTMLVDECDKLYGHKPGDDATTCVVRIRKRVPMNMLFGPPANRDDADRMMSLFFSKEGKHIICGGTTSSIAAKFLRKPLRATLNFEQSDVPPIAELEGVDLVTEGVITVNKVVEYAKDYLGENKYYEQWRKLQEQYNKIYKSLNDEKDLNLIKEINKFFPEYKVPVLPIAINVCAHCGPGTVGLLIVPRINEHSLNYYLDM